VIHASPDASARPSHASADGAAQPSEPDPDPRAEPPGPPPGAPILCLGEARAELICERPLGDLSGADAFVPHLGGSMAAIAVTAARLGARVSLAGGAGEDPWGRWLRDRLARERVGISCFALVAGCATPISLVAVSASGEPTHCMYGDAAGIVPHALAGRIEGAVEDAAGLCLGSGTLVEDGERVVTMRAREVALALGRPVVFDPALDLERWRSRAEAAAACNACVPGALLVRASAAEAAVMTGEPDPERAALALVKAGARMVVITLGPDGAILRGELRADADGREVPARSRIGAAEVTVRSTIGSGEAATGVLLARLATSGFYPAAAAAALPEAVAQAALAEERWGALE